MESFVVKINGQLLRVNTYMGYMGKDGMADSPSDSLWPLKQVSFDMDDPICEIRMDSFEMLIESYESYGCFDYTNKIPYMVKPGDSIQVINLNTLQVVVDFIAK